MLNLPYLLFFFTKILSGLASVSSESIESSASEWEELVALNAPPQALVLNGDHLRLGEFYKRVPFTEILVTSHGFSPKISRLHVVHPSYSEVCLRSHTADLSTSLARIHVPICDQFKTLLLLRQSTFQIESHFPAHKRRKRNYRFTFEQADIGSSLRFRYDPLDEENDDGQEANFLLANSFREQGFFRRFQSLIKRRAAGDWLQAPSYQELEIELFRQSSHTIFQGEIEPVLKMLKFSFHKSLSKELHVEYFKFAKKCLQTLLVMRDHTPVLECVAEGYFPMRLSKSMVISYRQRIAKVGEDKSQKQVFQLLVRQPSMTLEPVFEYKQILENKKFKVKTRQLKKTFFLTLSL